MPKDVPKPQHTSVTTVVAAVTVVTAVTAAVLGHSRGCIGRRQQLQIQSQARAHAVDSQLFIAPAELAADLLQYLNHTLHRLFRAFCKMLAL